MGKVNWLAPTGVTGMHPIVSMGPVSLGPGQAEGSWAYLPEVRVSVNPVKSMIQHKLVLNLHAPAAEVSSVLAPACDRAVVRDGWGEGGGGGGSMCRVHCE